MLGLFMLMFYIFFPVVNYPCCQRDSVRNSLQSECYDSKKKILWSNHHD